MLIDYGVQLLRKKPRTGRYHLVAIALDKSGNIIAKSYNSYLKTHPEQAKYAALAGTPYKCFLHAEMGALIKAKTQVDKLVVVRINRAGEPVNAKPCPICEMAIRAHGVKSVEYSV